MSFSTSSSKFDSVGQRLGAWSGTVAACAFVILWGSSAIVTRWALDHGSASAVLIARYAIALLVLLAVIGNPRRWLPEPGTRKRIAIAGLVMIAGYSVCYFESMSMGITPGMLAVVLGVQPVLTLLLLERRFTAMRLCGLLLALVGLVMVVWQSLMRTGFDVTGMAFALGALLCITTGSLLQKRVQQSPQQVLPLQYIVTLLVCAAFARVQPLRWEMNWSFWLPVLFLAIVTSVFAQLLLYRLIQGGNLVNVTSLFYLVPAVTAGLDFLVLGNAMSALVVLGMVCVLAGVVVVHRKPSSVAST
ncbi:DMT family transporter [Diaphorobacter sp. HDW4A]|uniref:DMT family transporter n=1 Tax=Diaphorobacter sp. HDW4A TaxID=2714924 RepID=UPI0014092319|nr:DMT family transporter [Diaphorobacter sp. HDW4A]QIL79500.1 DMT family transporter [Diaphorobacter sp. HDW4A]